MSVGLLLIVFGLCVQACSQAGEAPLDTSTSPPSEDLLTVTPTRLANPSFVAVEPTDVPVVDVLPIVTTLPTPQPSPFPDEREIAQAVMGQEIGGYWVAHPVDGGFTAPGAIERLALVGNIGDENEIRWVIVERGEEDEEHDGKLLGVSEWLGAGFDAPPPFYLPPDIIDFNQDGQQELLNHYFRVREGLVTGADTLYRWDGLQLARIWHIERVLDNLQVDSAYVSQPYRKNYRADWEWVGIDGIVVSETVRFYPETGQNAEDDPLVLGKESWQRQFCWNKQAMHPCAPQGPAGIFAYTILGDLWLWQNHQAHPLDAKNVIDFKWSQDGQRLAWMSQLSPIDDDLPEVVLGIYELETGEIRRFQMGKRPTTLLWLPDGRLAYTRPGSVDTGKPTAPDTQADWSVFFFDPAYRRVSTITDVPVGAWSPDGHSLIYERENTLYIYDLQQEEARPLVLGVEKSTNPLWSPRGDWIAYHLSHGGLSWPALVSPDARDPLITPDLLTNLDERAGAQLRLAWSADGSRLAALVYSPYPTEEPANLYVAQVPPGAGGYTANNLDWERLWQVENMNQFGELAWSWKGNHIALTFNQEIWDVSAEGDSKGQARRRQQFSIPGMTWSTLAWSPNDNGFLASLAWGDNERLFWIPMHEDDDVVPLLAGSIGILRWSSQVIESERDLEMVLVDYTAEDPVFHFVREGYPNVIISAKEDILDSSFQIGGDRVYYNYRYAHRLGGASLIVPDRGGNCHPPVVSADGEKLAWVCDERPPDWSALVNNTAEIPFHLIVSDSKGNNDREVWTHVETGPDYRSVKPLNWRNDGEVIYLSQPKYGAAQAYFDYNPGIMAFDLNTGEMELIGDLEDVYDAHVSSDGVWLIQSKVREQLEEEEIYIHLKSLVDDFERSVDSAEGTRIAGDFSFSPRKNWVAWREWVQTSGGSMLLIRAMRLPDGEALTVYGDIEDAAPEIGGWLREGELVMVYPVRQDGTGGNSAFIALPSVGPGAVFSPYSFVGVLERD
ncbi:MAG TPA: hypothetical protein ENN19_18035 [Chloroflexi bacterium]|nr:hypothetical protein [Chloroflexota bacterium]